MERVLCYDVQASPILDCPLDHSVDGFAHPDVAEQAQAVLVPVLHLGHCVLGRPAYRDDSVAVGERAFDKGAAHVSRGTEDLQRRRLSARKGQRQGPVVATPGRNNNTYDPHFRLGRAALSWRVTCRREVEVRGLGEDRGRADCVSHACVWMFACAAPEVEGTLTGIRRKGRSPEVEGKERSPEVEGKERSPEVEGSAGVVGHLQIIHAKTCQSVGKKQEAGMSNACFVTYM